MKRNILNILLFAGAAVAFSSCKDDDEKKAGTFKIDNISTTISTGVFIYDTSLGGTNDDIYLHEVVLLGEGLSWSDGEGVGEGNALTLGIVSATTALEPGTYDFTGTDIDSVPFDFWDGGVYLDVNTQDQQDFDFTEGTIIISKSGDVYTIDVTGASGEIAIEGHFSGKLVSVEKEQ